ncbi:polysaccharide pyruvyl transferase family protein [Bizionia myxarmorum]|uniref:Polysaccharide pyruvyl transferase family protein n=1 Tax=Bizionia myxarmorum TaxID=291186 RepID=A0A5D0RDN6_9FLAO|nr:polysaccharide pyruvyl transferase family protein [Bizionia myxarmorum]TYB79041.1 polysaccharide pyruvyl transferase family protein [Bizionia myxarmorum]
MKKIGIHGSYYVRNFGDTLILYIIKNWVKEYSQDIDISLPFVTSEKEAFEILNCENKIKEIRELDGLIFGPGGYFGEQPGSFVRRLLWSIRNYRRHISWNKELFKYKVPYMIVGVGVGPISFNFLKRKIIKLFEKAEFISVRDKYSKQYLVDWGVSAQKISIAPDVALTLSKANIKSENKTPKVALHYPNNKLIKSGKFNEFIQFIEKITVKYDVYLLEDAEGQFSNDREDNLKNILSKHGIELPIIRYKNPSKLITELQGMDKIITSKLHVGIVGYALGKPTLSIPLHTKTIRFYEQIKREEFCIPLSEINTKLLCDKFDELDETDNVLHEEAMNNKNIVYKFLDTFQIN